jgi:hypothetical protein
MKKTFQSMRSLRSLLCILLLASLAMSASGGNWVDLVSVSTAGEQTNEGNALPAISGDGQYVTFASTASNLVANDTNGENDVFVRDTATGTTTRVSVSSAGVQAQYPPPPWPFLFHPTIPDISGDGRYVVFLSAAVNLVAGDTNNNPDIFVRDIVAGTTTRVSVNSDGVESDGDVGDRPSISDDGRYVAFNSNASNLVASDINGAYDVFVRDTVAGTTTLVSVNSDGVQGSPGGSGPSAISGDGRYVAFISGASNLVADDTNGQPDVFVRDTLNGTTTRASVDSAGVEGNGFNQWPAISGNGRYVVFESLATNLVPNDINGQWGVYIRDIVNGTTTRANLNSDGVVGWLTSQGADISDDGRYVAFHSNGSNLVEGDTNFRYDVFVRDTVTDTTSRISLDELGTEANKDSDYPAISGDGRYVAFQSTASNLVADDTNAQLDIFVRAIPAVTVTSVIPDMLPIGDTTSVTITGSNFLPGTVPSLEGAEFSNILITDENTITADVTVPAATPDGLQDVMVLLPGTGPGQSAGAAGTCTDCITFIVVNCGCGC